MTNILKAVIKGKQSTLFSSETLEAGELRNEFHILRHLISEDDISKPFDNLLKILNFQGIVFSQPDAESQDCQSRKLKR